MAVLLATASEAFAIARPHHVHEDLFDERDLQLGFKLGPQVTSFLPYTQGDAEVNVKAGIRFVAGAAVKFIYPVPRFEVDFLWNARAWVNSEDVVNTLAIPVIGKIPLEVEPGVDFEFGVGGMPEFTIFGADPHKEFMMGVLGSVGMSVDFVTWIFDFDVRYNFGLDSVSTFFPGAKNRDLQVMAGVLWHF